MSPDPFHALDNIDPPDQWDEITRRAGETDVDVDLDAVRTLRPRRRATLLVAAAAAVALLAGIAVAGPDAGPDEGVTATDPSTPAETRRTTPCPFVLDDPDLPEPTPVPVEEVEEDTVVWRSVPEMEPDSTWGRVPIDGVEVLVGVGASVEDEVATGVHVAGTSSGMRRGDGTRAGPATVFVVGFAPLPGAEGCDLVKAAVAVPMLPEDDTESFVEADLDPLYYVEAGRLVIERVRDAVALTTGDLPPADDEPAPGDLLGDPCPFTLDGPGIPAPTPHTIPDTPDDLPGAIETAGRVTVDGFDVTVMLGGLPALEGPISGPAGTREVREGSPHPETGAIVVSGTLVVSTEVPCTDLQAYVEDVAPDRAGPARSVVERVLDAYVGEDGAPAPTTTTTTTTAPGQDPMAWEGRLTDGRTYRVEVDDGIVRAFADGVEVNPAVATEVPDWPTGPDDGSASAVGFELSPNPDGGPQDWVLVGARPPGAVETFVEAPDGVVELPSLTISPDGRLYALHGLELDFMEDPETPWPVKHRDATGTVIELP